MTAGELIAEVTAASPYLRPEQRVLVRRFVAAVIDHGRSAEITPIDHARRAREKSFEESELARVGDDRSLAQREREPA